MKTVSSVARILLGIVFTVFGLNGFLHFIPMGPPPAGFAGQYLGALEISHYLTVVFVLEFVAGILLLVNRYVPLALTTLAAIIVNILLFHALLGARWPSARRRCRPSLDRLGVERALGLWRPAAKSSDISEC